MIKIYGDLRSGNCYKVKLILHLLDMEHEWIHVDILKSETHTDEFKAINPNAKIPAMVMDGGDCLWESNAILNFLAEGTAYLPSKKYVHSQVLQWQFFEQYSHEPNVAVARYIKLYLGMPEDRKDEFESKLVGGYKALDIMEEYLDEHQFFVANMISIADISLYAYTHVADEGGFDLTNYPAINKWMASIESKLKHQTMQDFIYASDRKKRAEQRIKDAVAELKNDNLDLSLEPLDVSESNNPVSENSIVKDLASLSALVEKQETPYDILSDELNEIVDEVVIEPENLEAFDEPVDEELEKALNSQMDAEKDFEPWVEPGNTSEEENSVVTDEEWQEPSEESSAEPLEDQEVDEDESEAQENQDSQESGIYEYVLSDINGHPMEMIDYKGQVLLIVNVASECGLTPQYEGLQALQDVYSDQGFSVIGFPCNQFGGQEPKSEINIKRFCENQYKVSFPMTSKIEVNGVRRHPLFEHLAGEDATFPGDIGWNFSKFLIGKNGEVLKRYEPRIEPDDRELIDDLEAALEG